MYNIIIATYRSSTVKQFKKILCALKLDQSFCTSQLGIHKHTQRTTILQIFIPAVSCVFLVNIMSRKVYLYTFVQVGAIQDEPQVFCWGKLN